LAIGKRPDADAEFLAQLIASAREFGKWQVHPTFWLPSEGLAERANPDGRPDFAAG
jgi:hypothetical protein